MGGQLKRKNKMRNCIYYSLFFLWKIHVIPTRWWGMYCNNLLGKILRENRGVFIRLKNI
jgi:hypothetical protein